MQLAHRFPLHASISARIIALTMPFSLGLALRTSRNAHAEDWFRYNGGLGLWPEGWFQDGGDSFNARVNCGGPDGQTVYAWNLTYGLNESNHWAGWGSLLPRNSYVQTWVYNPGCVGNDPLIHYSLVTSNGAWQHNYYFNQNQYPDNWFTFSESPGSFWMVANTMNDHMKLNQVDQWCCDSNTFTINWDDIDFAMVPAPW